MITCWSWKANWSPGVMCIGGFGEWLISWPVPGVRRRSPVVTSDIVNTMQSPLGLTMKPGFSLVLGLTLAAIWRPFDLIQHSRIRYWMKRNRCLNKQRFFWSAFRTMSILLGLLQIHEMFNSIPKIFQGNLDLWKYAFRNVVCYFLHDVNYILLGALGLSCSRSHCDGGGGGEQLRWNRSE